MTSNPPVIDADLVRRLVRAQFPQWADLPVRPVDHDGWDNRTFRLGEGMTVRLPSAEAYAAQVDKEHTWLPRPAPHLPLPIPVPLAKGSPGEGYPFPWSVREWIAGTPAIVERVEDVTAFAGDLAAFLTALWGVDPSGGPSPGRHNFFRGGPPATYDGETRAAIAALGERIPADTATEIWDAALNATWQGSSTWFHGDVALGNLLHREGRLAAVIDFGTSGVGDPACDLTIAWKLPAGESRERFGASMPADEAMWTRARGWALWKCLITLAWDPDELHRTAERETLEAVLGEAPASGRDRSAPGVAVPGQQPASRVGHR